MSRVNTFTIEPFEYKMTLYDDVLQIIAKHVDECLVWSTIVEGILDDPESMKIEHREKQFIVNLEPEEIFDIFEFYTESTLDNNTKITFPTMFKNESEHICITIDFQVSFGKQRRDTKWIILEPEIIPKDVVHFQKLEHVKNIMLNKISDLNAKIEEINETLGLELDKTVCNLDEKYAELSLRLNQFKDDTKIKIRGECERKYQPKITTELATFDTSITQKCNSHTANEITSLRNFMMQELSKYQPKITTELTNLLDTIT